MLEANEMNSNYKELNQDLCLQIEKLEVQTNVKTAVGKKDAGKKLKEELEKNKILELKVTE